MNVYTPVFIITPVLLALAFGIIGFVFLYQRRMLQHQENLRQLQEAKQRQILDATVQAQEDERRRVARDLHDDVGAMLALVKLNVHQLNTKLEDKSSGAEVKKLLDEVIGSVRRISHELMPVVLEKMGLPQAIESLKRAVPLSSNIAFEFNCNDNNRRTDPKIELFLYRVVQELLNNTLKHAGASLIKVNLVFEAEQLLLEYTDNGRGFSYQENLQEQGNSKEGLGLMNLQGRVALLRGSLIFESSPNKGAKAFISVPIS